jgi:hypothetical protein
MARSITMQAQRCVRPRTGIANIPNSALQPLQAAAVANGTRNEVGQIHAAKIADDWSVKFVFAGNWMVWDTSTDRMQRCNCA